MIFLYVKASKLKKGFNVLVILLVAALFLTFFRVGNIGVFMNTKRKLPIYSVDTKEKKIAITFDASWGKDNTPEILQILDKYNVKATFFLVGAWVDEHEDMLKLIHEKGHEIGNHTNRHPDMAYITSEKLISEIEMADAKIRKVTGQSTTLFRCPGGVYNNTVIETVEKTKRYCIQWNVDSIDWKAEGADIEFNRIIKKTVPGSILLFHNEAPNTPKNLPRIFEHLIKEGYSFLKVSDLIHKQNYFIDANGKQILQKNN